MSIQRSSLRVWIPTTPGPPKLSVGRTVTWVEEDRAHPTEEEFVSACRAGRGEEVPGGGMAQKGFRGAAEQKEGMD